MADDRPFFRPRSTTLDTDQLLAEAIPLAKLVLVIGLVALIPVILQILFVEALGLVPISLGLFQFVFAVMTQFVLAVGAGLVLIYVIARGLQFDAE